MLRYRALVIWAVASAAGPGGDSFGERFKEPRLAPGLCSPRRECSAVDFVPGLVLGVRRRLKTQT